MPFSMRPYRRFHGMAFVVCLLSLSSIVGAESLWGGTGVLREPQQGGRLAMTVEEVGSGWKFPYKIVGPDAPGPIYSTVLTQLDAKDVPVLVEDRPSGQTMGIKKNRWPSHGWGREVSREGDGYLEGRALARWQDPQG